MRQLAVGCATFSENRVFFTGGNRRSSYESMHNIPAGVRDFAGNGDHLCLYKSAQATVQRSSP